MSLFSKEISKQTFLKKKNKCFSNYLGNKFVLQSISKNRTIHMVLNDTFHFFQITIIYKGTQVTNAAAVARKLQTACGQNSASGH